MLAHMANEDHMIKAFNEGLDIHTKTATLIFNCSPEEVDEHKRRIAKDSKLWNCIWSNGIWFIITLNDHAKEKSIYEDVF